MLNTAQPNPTIERISSRLVGVWTLVAYTEQKEGCKDTNPLGPKPVGFLIYTSDGFVSAQLMKPGVLFFNLAIGIKERRKSMWNPEADTSPTAGLTRSTRPTRL